ncbi:MAG TPA: hypothetical protein VIK18_16695 [Pirellulales bacterium]
MAMPGFGIIIIVVVVFGVRVVIVVCVPVLESRHTVFGIIRAVGSLGRFVRILGCLAAARLFARLAASSASPPATFRPLAFAERFVRPFRIGRLQRLEFVVSLVISLVVAFIEHAVDACWAAFGGQLAIFPNVVVVHFVHVGVTRFRVARCRFAGWRTTAVTPRRGIARFIAAAAASTPSASPAPGLLLAFVVSASGGRWAVFAVRRRCRRWRFHHGRVDFILKIRGRARGRWREIGLADGRPNRLGTAPFSAAPFGAGRFSAARFNACSRTLGLRLLPGNRRRRPRRLRFHRSRGRRRQAQAAGQLPPIGRGLRADGRLGSLLLARGGRRRRRGDGPRRARLCASTQLAGQVTPMISFFAFAHHDLKVVWRMKRPS